MFRHPANIVFLLICLGFLGKEFSRVHSLGSHFNHADGFSEDHSKEGAENFFKLGFAYSGGLQVWPRFDQDTNVPILKEKRIYTHYYPGPDYVIAMTFAVFGISDFTFQWTRLIPLFLIFFSIVAFILTMQNTYFDQWPWFKSAFAPLLFWPPAMRWWSISLHGHGYVTAIFFTLCAITWYSSYRSPSKSDSIFLFVLAFLLGIVSNYMLLTFAFVVCAAPLVSGLLIGTKDSGMNGVKLSFVVGLGLVAAFFLHLAQIAWVVDSWAVAWDSQLRIAGIRAVVERSEPITRIMLIGRYSEYCAQFWWIGSLPLVVLGLFICSLQKVGAYSQMRIYRVLGLLVAFLSSYAWVMALKNHSIDHPHVNPRIFIVLHMAFLVLCAQLAYERILDGRRN